MSCAFAINDTGYGFRCYSEFGDHGLSKGKQVINEYRLGMGMYDRVDKYCHRRNRTCSVDHLHNHPAYHNCTSPKQCENAELYHDADEFIDLSGFCR